MNRERPIADITSQIAEIRKITKQLHSFTESQEILKLASDILYDLLKCKVVVCLKGQDSTSVLEDESLKSAFNQAATLRKRVEIKGDTFIYAWPLTTPIGNDIGVVGITDLGTDRKFTEVELLYLDFFTEQLALALESTLVLSQNQRALSESASLYQILSGLNSAQDYSSILKAITIHTVLNQADQFVMMGLFDANSNQDHSPEWVIPVAYDSLVQAQLESRYLVSSFEDIVGKLLINDPVLIIDTESEKKADLVIQALFKEKFKAKSLLIIPLIIGEKTIGFVMGCYGELVSFNQLELERLYAVASQVAIAVQRFQLYETTVGIATKEKLLREITTKLISANTIEEVLKCAVFDVGKFFNKQALIKVNLPNSSLGFLFDYVEEKTSLLKFDTENLKIFDDWSSGSETIATSTMAISITIREESVGLLGIIGETEFIVSQGDYQFLKSVTHQVAHSLERARLMDQAYKSSMELQTVAQVLTAASTILDPKELLHSVAFLAKKSFDLYHVQIFLIDDAETQLFLAAWTNDMVTDFDSLAWTLFLCEDCLVALAGRTRKGQYINDVRAINSYVTNFLLPNTASEIAIPMIVGQKLIGVFDAHSSLPGRFAEDDIQTFTTLATQTAVAWQNAKLFSEQLHTVERLRELDNLKNSFLANMSHELRTPLNSILGFTQVILEEIDGPLTEYMRSDLKLIEKNSNHLLKLINEILDMAKIESGRMSLTKERFDFRDLITDVMESISPQVQEKSLYLKLELRDSDDLYIFGDEMRLRQVFLNLIGNSVKFTETGGITVTVNRMPDHLHIQVHDTGIGIPAEKLEMIFEAFTQVDSSTTRKAGGTGLGLPISRRLIELHRGKLYGESKGISGKGSTFHVEVPIKA